MEEIIEPEVFSGEPGNPIGMGMGMMPSEGYEGSMMSMYGMGSPSRSFSEEELANIRAIATLLLENGLTSAKLKTAADIANLTKEKLDAGRRDEEFSTTEDSDGDGFDDYDESLLGPDGSPIGDKNDPNVFPTHEQIKAAAAADE